MPDATPSPSERTPGPSEQASFPNERTSVRLAGAGLVLAGLAAYAGSWSGPMLYDDIPSIADNPTIRHLWPLWDVLATPALGALTTSGRPVLNLSFALNYAISGNEVWSYHALNVLIHLAAALALFGIVRRTLIQVGTGTRVGTGGPPVRPGLESKAEADGRAARPCLGATSLAFAVALLWTVHPLQTEAVSYIVQRAESLMGMFYLLTLYGFIRYATAPAEARVGRRCWFGLTVGCCLLGMGTKEVMATAPLMLLLFDRTFLAGTWREAWRRRWGIYMALAATWLPLALLVASTGGNRGGSVGFGLAVKWWAYGLTQFEAVTRYLGLAFWPHPLVFEYGMFWVTAAGQVLPFVLPVLLLLGVTVWFLLCPDAGAKGRGHSLSAWSPSLVRRSLGFFGAWFFGILAPSSLMPGTTQMIVEHRMYLPLAAPMAFLVLGIDAILLAAWQSVGTARPPQVGAGGPPVRVAPEASPEPAAARAARSCLLLCLALAVAFGVLTHRRNESYRSGLALWGDTVAKRPGNVVARFNLGTALFQLRQIPAAMDQFERAVQLRPDLAATHYNLASELSKVGQPAAAVAEYAEALRIDPGYAEAQDGWGIALALLGRPAEAIPHYQEALRLRPDYAQAHDNLGNALLQLDRGPEAAAEYAEAVRIDPGSALAQTNLGSELLQLGRTPEAIPHLIEAVEQDPTLVEAHAKLGDAWMESERPADAIQQYEAALGLNPNYVQAQNNLGIALAATGRLPEAVDHYEAALRLEPDLADAHYNLANTLFRLGRPAEAAAQYEAVLQLRPGDSAARTRLDLARQAAARGRRP